MSDMGGDGTADVRFRYFEGILPFERASIDRRRATIFRDSVAPVPPPGDLPGTRAPRPGQPSATPARSLADPRSPDPVRQRPEPDPCDATGLALSGGGIRSAAVCLGVLQALQHHHRLATIDYLSTVSGGGYIGSALSAAMRGDAGRAAPGQGGVGAFPFGEDVKDSLAVAHLRNYSNYLLPRSHGAARNWADAAAVLLRGLVANTVVVGSFLLILALATGLLLWADKVVGHGWLLPAAPAALLALVLLAWALVRSLGPQDGQGDLGGPWLPAVRWVLYVVVVLCLAALHVRAVQAAPYAAIRLRGWIALHPVSAGGVVAALSVLAGAVPAFSGLIGMLLKTTERATAAGARAKRGLLTAAVLLASCVVPLLLWLALVAASVALMAHPLLLGLLYSGLWVAGTAVSLLLRANAYSLNRFYRDRLSKAFLPGTGHPPDRRPGAIPLTDLQDGGGPYHIINCALNVQGSVEANRRGREADFFIFTPHHVGSDLTLYTEAARYGAAAGQGPQVDPALDLGTAVAISGAAFSANMGGSTLRTLSPTLALLNVRLGYWLPNPRHVALTGDGPWQRLLRAVTDKLFLPREILNLLDETSSSVYLTDGGHIENLGIYELLKRGCRCIVAVDAEADPELAFPSLLRLERYARIDFGIRIVLPWADIARAHAAAARTAADPAPLQARGPHCAIGRIFYADGQEGVLLYVKASVTGDEKDYILDYRRRYPAFPHETTGDQFFTEEQFEMYRALGFHMVDRFFTTEDAPAFRTDHFADAAAARAAVGACIYAVPPTSP